MLKDIIEDGLYDILRHILLKYYYDGRIKKCLKTLYTGRFKEIERPENFEELLLFTMKQFLAIEHNSNRSILKIRFTALLLHEGMFIKVSHKEEGSIDRPITKVINISDFKPRGTVIKKTTVWISSKDLNLHGALITY